MTREELQAVSEALKAAAEAATSDDVRERLHGQSETFADLATAERGPDHGRLARHESKLHDIADDAGGEVADHIEDALDHISTYRETLPGV